MGDAAFQQKCFDEFTRLQGGGKDDRVRHPRHGRGRALLRPGDADGARPGGRHRRSERDRPRVQRAQLRRDRPSSRSCDGPDEQIRPGPRSPRSLDAWFESDDRRATVTAHPGRAVHVRHGDRVPRRDRTTRSSRSASTNEAGQIVFAASTDWRAWRRPATSTPASTRSSGCASTTGSAPGRYRLLAAVARAGLGADALDTPRCASSSSSSPSASGGDSRPAQHARDRATAWPRGRTDAELPGSVARRADDASEPERAYGPSALGGGRRRFVELTLTLARTEFKLRYFGSVLGYFWSLMRPLLFFGVLYLFFTQIFKLGKGIPHYGGLPADRDRALELLRRGDDGMRQCLLAREAMLAQDPVPPDGDPAVGVADRDVQPGMNFIAVFVFALANGVTPKLSWLELIPIAGAFVVLATGVGMLLSALYVRYRDVQPIWDVVVSGWFYCSPVMYAAARTQLRPRLRARRAAESDRDAAHADGPRRDRPSFAPVAPSQRRRSGPPVLAIAARDHRRHVLVLGADRLHAARRRGWRRTSSGRSPRGRALRAAGAQPGQDPRVARPRSSTWASHPSSRARPRHVEAAAPHLARPLRRELGLDAAAGPAHPDS